MCSRCPRASTPRHSRSTGRRNISVCTARLLPRSRRAIPHLPAVDERPYVEELSRGLGLKLHVVERHVRFLEGLQEWVKVLDGPIPKISTNDAHEGYTQVRELGYRTMITGEIAEYLTDQRSALIPYLVGPRQVRVSSGHQIRGREDEGLGSWPPREAGAAGVRPARVRTCVSTDPSRTIPRSRTGSRRRPSTVSTATRPRSRPPAIDGRPTS